MKILNKALLAFGITLVGYTNLTAQEIQKVEPVAASNVFYNENLLPYSVYQPTEQTLIKFAENRGIPAIRVKALYNRVDNDMSIELSAYAYDYAYKRADLAEFFYNYFPKRNMSLLPKIKHADFLLRTGRVDKISTVLNKTDCMSSFKLRSLCYYYLGVEKYLLTGDNKNPYINLAKDKITQADKIYNSKGL